MHTIPKTNGGAIKYYLRFKFHCAVWVLIWMHFDERIASYTPRTHFFISRSPSSNNIATAEHERKIDYSKENITNASLRRHFIFSWMAMVSFALLPLFHYVILYLLTYIVKEYYFAVSFSPNHIYLVVFVLVCFCFAVCRLQQKYCDLW